MSVVKEMKVITDAIKNDEGYRIGWQANIAMSFVDEFRRTLDENSDVISYEMLHDISNRAANNFIDLLIRESK